MSSDNELEDQLDEVIQKTIKDLKTRISRIVTKHVNRLLKNQSREFKESVAKKADPPKRRSNNDRNDRNDRNDKKEHSDNESDEYSE